MLFRSLTMLLSDVLESLREGNWRAADLEAGGGMEMLARSTLRLVVLGSDDRPFLLETREGPGGRRCEVFHDLVLSPLEVRTSCSITSKSHAVRHTSMGETACFFPWVVKPVSINDVSFKLCFVII